MWCAGRGEVAGWLGGWEVAVVGLWEGELST